MLFHLLSVFAVGAFLALCTYLVTRWFKFSFSTFLICAVAAGGMIIYGAWAEYSWASRTIGELPSHVKVGKVYSGSSYFAPWTFLFPRTDRMILVDVSKIRKNDKHPDVIMAELILMNRYANPGQVFQLFDCNSNRQADVPQLKDSSGDAFIRSAQWRDVEQGDGVLRAVCDEKTS